MSRPHVHFGDFLQCGKSFGRLVIRWSSSRRRILLCVLGLSAVLAGAALNLANQHTVTAAISRQLGIHPVLHGPTPEAVREYAVDLRAEVDEHGDLREMVYLRVGVMSDPSAFSELRVSWLEDLPLRVRDYFPFSAAETAGRDSMPPRMDRRLLGRPRCVVVNLTAGTADSASATPAFSYANDAGPLGLLKGFGYRLSYPNTVVAAGSLLDIYVTVTLPTSRRVPHSTLRKGEYTLAYAIDVTPELHGGWQRQSDQILPKLAEASWIEGTIDVPGLIVAVDPREVLLSSCQNRVAFRFRALDRGLNPRQPMRSYDAVMLGRGFEGSVVLRYDRNPQPSLAALPVALTLLGIALGLLGLVRRTT